jgi:hypothetical protein
MSDIALECFYSLFYIVWKNTFWGLNLFPSSDKTEKINAQRKHFKDGSNIMLEDMVCPARLVKRKPYKKSDRIAYLSSLNTKIL